MRKILGSIVLIGIVAACLWLIWQQFQPPVQREELQMPALETDTAKTETQTEIMDRFIRLEQREQKLQIAQQRPQQPFIVDLPPEN